MLYIVRIKIPHNSLLSQKCKKAEIYRSHKLCHRRKTIKNIQTSSCILQVIGKIITKYIL